MFDEVRQNVPFAKELNSGQTKLNINVSIPDVTNVGLSLFCPKLNRSYSKWFLNKIQIDKSLTHERSDELTSSLVVHNVSHNQQSFQLHLTETKTIDEKSIRIPR